MGLPPQRRAHFWSALGLMLLLGAMTDAALSQPQSQSPPPDVGVLERDKPPQAPPAAASAIPKSSLAPAPSAQLKAAEREVVIDRVVVEGCTVIDPDSWDAVFASVGDRPVTLREMREMAERVQALVHAAGRPFALAYLPPQDISRHTLLIRVVEGRYGQVRVDGGLAGASREWLEALAPGRPLGTELERQMQLLSELPGVKAIATVSPGEHPGEGDVTVEVSPARRWQAALRVDNEGNHYAGPYQLTGTLQANRLLTLGDRLALALGANDGGGLQGALSYGLPLGVGGTRLNVSATSSRYALGKEFEVLGAKGQVHGLEASLSTPLQVTSQTRVVWQSDLLTQRIISEQTLFNLKEARRNTSWVNGLQGWRRLPGGGVVWGQVSAEVGRVRLEDPAARRLDDVTAQTAAGYLLLTADLSAIARMPQGWAVFWRLAGQAADRNLDPSKKLVLGGANGVRAWPASEGAGDDGVLTQLELRRRIVELEPFVFLDAGQVQVNHRPWSEGRNEQSLVGAGIGLRWWRGAWELQGTAGWRVGAERQRPRANPSARPLQLWVSLGYSL